MSEKNVLNPTLKLLLLVLLTIAGVVVLGCAGFLGDDLERYLRFVFRCWSSSPF